jgi:hypothetical protein
MDLLSVIVVLVVIGVVLYLVETYLPIDAALKVIIRTLVILVVIIWLVRLVVGPIQFPTLR